MFYGCLGPRFNSSGNEERGRQKKKRYVGAGFEEEGRKTGERGVRMDFHIANKSIF